MDHVLSLTANPGDGIFGSPSPPSISDQHCRDADGDGVNRGVIVVLFGGVLV